MQQPGEGLCSCPWGGAELRLGGCHQLPAEALGETHPILRKAGVPLDNNIVERALKKAILHRKNSLFYKTRKGAQMGDLFMSVIHTCELNEVNAFDYLTKLLRHVEELKQDPSEWMPWNYRDTLAR